jgi:hypothetical protein
MPRLRPRIHQSSVPTTSGTPEIARTEIGDMPRSTSRRSSGQRCPGCPKHVKVPTASNWRPERVTDNGRDAPIAGIDRLTEVT